MDKIVRNSLFAIIILLLAIVAVSVTVLASPRTTIHISGISMNPTFFEGDWVYGHPPVSFESLEVGDIVGFYHNGQQIIHRIFLIVSPSHIETVGDNNIEVRENGDVHVQGEWICYSDVVFVYERFAWRSD